MKTNMNTETRITSRSVLTLSLFIVTIVLIGCGSEVKAEVEKCNAKEGVIPIGTCITGLALAETTEKSALKICDMIDSGMRNSCRRDVAVTYNDIELCNNNDNEVDTFICLANIAENNKDESICSTIISKKDEEFCFRKVAIAKLDATVCDNITENEEFKANCSSSVVNAQAIIDAEKANGAQ